MRFIKHTATILLYCGLQLFPALRAWCGAADLTIVRLKYSGGGDWYNDPSIIPNLLSFIGAHSSLSVARDEGRLSLMDEELFAHPILFMTGHGRITFTATEADRLRAYLTGGGFLLADDDYGMDEHFRREIRKVFPDHELVELPFSHPIFQAPFSFPQGMPKTHEHDGGPPQAFALFHEGRMVLFYCFNSNISDGWADENVHHDPPEVREKALEMGMNIIVYALTH
ncbi:MAG TPA: DUF4159 domain-containing protein [bacterium]|nr:DUF4159 domain-containing protein [bacterium]HQG44097.1 DUF4159 domain-containing protein [bacterium]HQI47570.1 DUF4159 domain-containing protein [bacterium]HQJ63346.1 DUF4159 domain-containing protein [bacterium]